MAVLLVATIVMTVIAAMVGTTISIANAVSVNTLSSKAYELSYDLKEQQPTLDGRKGGQSEVIRYVNDTILDLNEHATILENSTNIIVTHYKLLCDILNVVTPFKRIMTKYAQEIQNAVSHLIQGHRPLYLVSSDIHQMMSWITQREVEIIQ